ncbi:MAG: hypothetical protein ACOH2P_17555 [Pseudomonas sp.]
MKWLEVTRDDLDFALASIQTGHGSKEAAQDLIEYFHERMSNGYSYDEDFLRKLMEYVFAEIVEGKKSADQAFGLKSVRGKYEREDTTERDVTAAACMVLLIRKGTLWLAAKGDTANLLFPIDKGDKAVERAYQKYRAEIEYCPDEVLLDMLGPLADTPIIKLVMAG